MTDTDRRSSTGSEPLGALGNRRNEGLRLDSTASAGLESFLLRTNSQRRGSSALKFGNQKKNSLAKSMSKVSLKGLIKSKHADIEEANEKKDLKDHGARYDVATLRLVVMPLITESLTNFYAKYKNVIKGRAKENKKEEKEPTYDGPSIDYFIEFLEEFVNLYISIVATQNQFPKTKLWYSKNLIALEKFVCKQLDEIGKDGLSLLILQEDFEYDFDEGADSTTLKMMTTAKSFVQQISPISGTALSSLRASTHKSDDNDFSHPKTESSEEDDTVIKNKRLSKKISLTKSTKGKENDGKGHKFDQVMKLIYIASNYDINQFVCHDVIQEILKNHGMRSLFRDWKYALASVLFYIIYPLAYFIPFLNQYLNHPTINQLLPIWGITLCIPFFVWHGYWNSRIEMQSVSYSKVSQNVSCIFK